MFGTLQCHVPQQVPLTFVQDNEPNWVSTRIKRENCHTSCELCRKRKIRCDGNVDGCRSCLTTSARCRYPPREGRVKKRAISASKIDEEALPAKLRCSHNKSPSLPIEQARCQPRQDDGHFNMARSPKSKVDWTGGADLEPWLEPFLVETDRSKANVGVMINHGASRTGQTSSQAVSGRDVSLWNKETSDQLAWDPSVFNLFGDFEDYTSLTNDITTISTISPAPKDQPQDSLSAIVSQDQKPSGNPVGAPNNNPHHRNHIRQASSNALQDARLAQFPPSEGPKPISSTSSTFTPPGGCRCVQRTASLLDELGTNISNKRVTIDVLLHHLRKALGHCSEALDCERCASLSENNMLLAMAARYMSNLCERIVTSYIALMQASGNEAPAPQTLHKISEKAAHIEDDEDAIDETKRDHSMWFDSYRIESCLEMKQVLRCIVSVNLHDYFPLLERMKERASNRAGYLEVLEAERRMKTVRSMLSSQNPPLI